MAKKLLQPYKKWEVGDDPHISTTPNVALGSSFLRGSPPMRVDSTAHILTLNGLRRTGRTAQVVVLFT